MNFKFFIFKNLFKLFKDLPLISIFGAPALLFLISTSLNFNLFSCDTALNRASLAANLFAKHSIYFSFIANTNFKISEYPFLKKFFYLINFNSININYICTDSKYIHFDNIFLNFLIVSFRPTKMDSPTKKWPILNSLTPLIFDKILPVIKFIP